MNVLVIAPHRDDEILGVGGTILKRKSQGDKVTVCVVTAREGEIFAPESLTAKVHQEMKDAHAFCGIDKFIGLPFGPVILENYPRKNINKAIYDAIVISEAEEVYIPHWGDMQKDHQIVADAAMVALRPKYGLQVKRIYAYETLSETGLHYPSTEKVFIPTVYEDISEYLEKKLKAMECYKSQMSEFPGLRSSEAIESLARYRGALANVKAAEAFVLVREIK